MLGSLTRRLLKQRRKPIGWYQRLQGKLRPEVDKEQ